MNEGINTPERPMCGGAFRASRRPRRSARHRRVRVYIQLCFAALFVLGVYVVKGFPQGNELADYADVRGGSDWTALSGGRRLLADEVLNKFNETCTVRDQLCQLDDCPKDGVGALVFSVHTFDAGFFGYLFVMFYTFVGIAIICDELFVPALEVIAEKWKLSNDVAGATLMAAGGSAPELATSVIGVFKGSDIGFAAIVGSAVFNVLFVIAMCALYTPAKYAPLSLTWWPLARDCTYYIFALVTLACFFIGPWSAKSIDMWEALVQFSLYIGYVVLMYYSERLESWFKEKVLKKSPTKQIHVAPVDSGHIDEGGNGGGGSSSTSCRDGTMDPNAEFHKPSTFRLGVLEILTTERSLADGLGVRCVAQINGNAVEVFKEVDENGNGKIEPSELKNFMVQHNLDGNRPPDDASISSLMQEIDERSTTSGSIERDVFLKWYKLSEERIHSEMQAVFRRFDTNQSGTIDVAKMSEVLRSLGHTPTRRELEDAEAAINQTEGELNLQDFKDWYSNSLFWTEQKEGGAAAAAAGDEDELKGFAAIRQGFADFSEKNTFEKISFLLTLPLAASAALVPDPTVEGQEHWSYFVFLYSIVAIGILCVFMVEAATVVGFMLCIPEVVMGLVVLAAGTSVPDLISSVIVAKQGEGDMAVSSSIGSNIFDVCVGLPIPWILFGLVYSCPVGVEADNLPLSLVILIAMVFFVIATVAMSNWKMTKTLGGAMFVFYLFYLLQDMIRVFLSGEDQLPGHC